MLLILNLSSDDIESNNVFIFTSLFNHFHPPPHYQEQLNNYLCFLSLSESIFKPDVLSILLKASLLISGCKLINLP